MIRHHQLRNLLAGLTGLALIGLIVLQAILLVNAYELKQEAFRKSAEAALNAAARSLEVENTLSHVFVVNSPRWYDSTAHPIRPGSRGFTFSTGSSQHMRLSIHTAGGQDSVVFDSIAGPGEVSVPYPRSRVGGNDVTYSFTTDSLVTLARVESTGSPAFVSAPRSAEGQRQVMARVIESIWRTPSAAAQLPVRPALLDSVLRSTVSRSGLPDDLAYGVLSFRGDSLLVVNRTEESANLLRSDLRVPLSLIDPLGPHYTLVAYFPGKEVFLIQQLALLIAASLLFVVMIAASFVVTLRTIARQRRLTVMLTDFVNTMTHEFKTPISTVSLASEAIGRPDVVTKKGKVLQYNRVIAEEAERMKGQVNRILEMAHLESHESDLAHAPVDLHVLLSRAATSFAVRVESLGGRLTTDLLADRRTVTGDTVHLEGVFHNLLDNAVKYSPGRPEVAIRTVNTADAIIITVADRGKGIPPGFQRFVFEKYFRVPQGNRHDIKGFGLGLSYVKLVVEAHGGSVSLSSAPGEGTTIAVTLPVVENETA
jgi:two-component system phosphate regulon sensor histidine kinase PhoR